MKRQVRYTVWDKLEPPDFNIVVVRESLFKEMGRTLALEGDNLIIKLEFYSYRRPVDGVAEHTDWGSATVYVLEATILNAGEDE